MRVREAAESGVRAVEIRHLLCCARRQRKPLLTARLLHVKGVIEKEGDIVHVMAGKLSDLSHLINSLPVSSRDFH